MSLTFELIIFISAALFGILLYWRESQSNRIYRFFNKLFNSKELQMKPSDKKGFVYQQSFLLRLVFLTALFLVGIVIARFIIPIDLATISLFASMIFGTLAGTYLANFIFKSSEVIDQKSDSLEDLVSNTIEKGKDFIEDLKPENKSVTSSAVEKKKVEEKPKAQEKSARERLKDKGLM